MSEVFIIYTVPTLILAMMVIIEDIKIDRIERRVREIEQREAGE